MRWRTHNSRPTSARAGLRIASTVSGLTTSSNSRRGVPWWRGRKVIHASFIKSIS